MPRFKLVDYSHRLLAVDLAHQIAPGSSEYALHHLLDGGAIGLTGIEARYRNDTVGASAYAPRLLLKIVLLAYSKGIISGVGFNKQSALRRMSMRAVGSDPRSNLVRCNALRVLHPTQTTSTYGCRRLRAAIAASGKSANTPSTPRRRKISNSAPESPCCAG